MEKHPNIGSTLDDFLNEEGINEKVTAIAVKRVIAWQLKEEMQRRSLTKSAMAKLMATSRSQLDQVLDPEVGNVTLDTLQRAARAVGRTLRLELA